MNESCVNFGIVWIKVVFLDDMDDSDCSLIMMLNLGLIYDVPGLGLKRPSFSSRVESLDER